MLDLSVVVLPAPLRPSSVTTSPCITSNVTPWRMCDSPYHALRSRTVSRVALADAGAARAAAASAMLGPQIRFHDGRVLRHGRVIAFGEHLATGEHRDVIGKCRDDRQV